MNRPILNKRDFVARYAAGEFGNAGPTWENVEEFIDMVRQGGTGIIDGPQKYHLRNRTPGGHTFYNLDVIGLLTRYHEVGNKSNWYVSAMAPTEKTLLQGEITRGYCGLELTYTTVKKPMRDALAECTCFTSGIMAKMLLQRNLDHNSYDWLIHLLDRYNDHIVEFSTYAVQWGTIKGYNTVFWEVRPNRPFSSTPSRFTEVY